MGSKESWIDYLHIVEQATAGTEILFNDPESPGEIRKMWFTRHDPDTHTIHGMLDGKAVAAHFEPPAEEDAPAEEDPETGEKTRKGHARKGGGR